MCYYRRQIVIVIVSLCISAGLFAGGSRDKASTGTIDETALQKRIDAYFFYEEICGSCTTDIDWFASILQEHLPFSERSQYPHSFREFNIYHTTGRARYVQVTDELGLDRGLLELPFLIIRNRVLQGYDSIKANIKDAFLTAAEDLFAD
jgi:hypothetical protein